MSGPFQVNAKGISVPSIQGGPAEGLLATGTYVAKSSDPIDQWPILGHIRRRDSPQRDHYDH